MTRGELRIYLGAAPGVGKTYTMLEEAHRRAERGTDVVVALVETHGRRHTQAMLADLEVLPRRTIRYRGVDFTELDVDAVLARNPELVIVDELAHSNVPGSRHGKRWEDITELLDAGIDVLSTVNVQHLESLNDVVAQITGVEQRETVPDAVVRAAEQVELVDMTPEALRRRMAHGNIYRPEKIDAALGNYFRTGNLTALRELALLWLADKVEDQLGKYRTDNKIDATWETRERVVVALTGGPEGGTLIRRAARIATRTAAPRSGGADLMAVHVTRNDGLAGADPATLARHRVLVESLGGSYHEVAGTDVPQALLDFARAVNATQIVLGVSSRGRLAQLLSAGVGVTTTALSGTIDVHLVPHERASQGRSARRIPPALSRGRRLAGYCTTLAGLPALTALLSLGPSLSLTNDILLFLAAVVGVALIGGLWPALLAAVAGSLLLNYCFTPPLGRFTIAEGDNLLALAIFVAVALAVSWVVDTAARRTRQAARAGADAQILATVAGSVLRGDRPLTALLERLRETFTLDSVTLVDKGTVVAEVTRPTDPLPPATPLPPTALPTAPLSPATPLAPSPPTVSLPAASPPTASLPAASLPAAEVKVDGELVMLLRGHPLAASDRRIIEAFAAQASVALRQERLTAEAATAKPLAEADRMRTALLAAVSHDLRTPLASAKAAVASLRSDDVHFDEHDRAELLETADESLDRLTRLVTNLLDMSRLQAGAFGVTATAIGAEEIVPRALDDLGPDGRTVTLHIPDDLPALHADPGLLERVLVNLTANALRHSPAARPPVITASSHGHTVEIRIIDHGPGIPENRWPEVFLPFQRLGDHDNHSGVGLGLALSRGLTEAMHGTLTPEETPGGGLTMIIALPTSSPGTPT
ncbi:sensor histidine kinase KdpD [Winogradskya consettensis]|uniref:histidine kinase n=1 Tax=Winogradskya consettensis TaxID=113560 RepID=A0A919VRB8_9ACTN|nr:sensor histidine kinase KdpD [Actinoplanes consettensis]GIM72730.1 sensor histidine kinase [Actinoplanes consettensis]